MNKKRIKQIILSVILACSLVFSGMTSARVKSVPNTKVTITANENQVVHKGRVLIYSSHTCEKNADSTVTEVAIDLANKLRSRGYFVDHVQDNFVKNGYKNAYHESRKMLLDKQLSTYQIVVDIHFDAAPLPISTEVNGNEVARLMFPTVSENPNLEQQKNLIENIKSKLNEFSNSIVRAETTNYKKGITYYNSDLTPNFILVEVGGDKNNIWSCKRAVTYLSSAIDSTLNNY